MIWLAANVFCTFVLATLALSFFCRVSKFVADVLNRTILSFMAVADVLKLTNLSFIAVADVLNDTSRVSMFAKDSFLNTAEIAGFWRLLPHVQLTVEELLNVKFPHVLFPPPKTMLCTTSVIFVPFSVCTIAAVIMLL